MTRTCHATCISAKMKRLDPYLADSSRVFDILLQPLGRLLAVPQKGAIGAAATALGGKGIAPVFVNQIVEERRGSHVGIVSTGTSRATDMTVPASVLKAVSAAVK